MFCSSVLTPNHNFNHNLMPELHTNQYKYIKYSFPNQKLNVIWFMFTRSQDECKDKTQ